LDGERKILAVSLPGISPVPGRAGVPPDAIFTFYENAPEGAPLECQSSPTATPDKRQLAAAFEKPIKMKAAASCPHSKDFVFNKKSKWH
jgi:hypothetical protein